MSGLSWEKYYLQTDNRQTQWKTNRVTLDKEYRLDNVKALQTDKQRDRH